MNFEIAGYETARIYINIDKWKVDLILQNVLHILELHLNLISILRIYSQELDVVFGLNMVTAQFSKRDMAIKRV